jgi:UDP-N-acetylglucosamine acyltransferase
VTIHPTALVNPGAELSEDVEVGPYAVIEDEVLIGPGSKIGPFVYLGSGARLGSKVQVFNGAVIATVPQDLKFHGETSTVEIGSGTIIREYATIHRGTEATGRTVVGSNCFLMAYSHVAHDCVIENKVIMANCVNLAGHVHLEEHVSIGGIVPVHQFVRIGRHSFIGGGFRVPKDVPPYILAAGEPLKFAGLNIVGLKRRGFSLETINALKQAYHLIYNSDLNVSQGIVRIREEMTIIPEVQQVIDFIEHSERGVI